MVWGADVGCWGCSGAAQGQQTGRSGPPEARSVRSRRMARNRRPAALWGTKKVYRTSTDLKHLRVIYFLHQITL